MDEIEKFIIEMISEKKVELTKVLIDSVLRDLVSATYDIMMRKAMSNEEFSEQWLFDEVKKMLEKDQDAS